jgi:catechol 2,3-dioxygenase-like lactoylglutathione lyase family enzyme
VTHRILLREVVIDVPSAALAAAQQFWSGALLADARPLDDDPEFIALDGRASLPYVGLQDVGEATARMHLDIETDDIEAEVARLVALGATEVARPKTWVVLRDPAGLLFCVVNIESPNFAERSRVVE